MIYLSDKFRTFPLRLRPIFPNKTFDAGKFLPIRDYQLKLVAYRLTGDQQIMAPDDQSFLPLRVFFLRPWHLLHQKEDLAPAKDLNRQSIPIPAQLFQPRPTLKHDRRIWASAPQAIASWVGTYCIAYH
jgi:hypothetical protein